MKETISFSIDNNTQLKRRESIEIPCELSRLNIWVQFPEDCRYLTFLFVEDPDGSVRLQKQLAYGEQHLQIADTPERTSVGAVPGKIQKGKWTFQIYLFTEYVKHRKKDSISTLSLTVSDEDTLVTEPMCGNSWIEEDMKISSSKYRWNKKYQEKAGWFKGDFHTHTRLSDGKETVENAMKKAEMMDLDFYVPTEHNVMHTGWRTTDLCIIPGIELTTDKGHMNLFGLTQMPEKLRDIILYNGTEKAETYLYDTLEEAQKKNWITSINHPFLTVWQWRYEETPLDKIDCIEVINDPTYTYAEASNEKAVRFIDELWKDGHVIYGVGGSDSHNLIEERYEGANLPSIAGDPATYVYCENLTPENILEGVRCGHVCVARYMTIETQITVDGRKYLPGDRIPDHAEHVTYKIVTGAHKEMPEIILIEDGKKKILPVKQTGKDQFMAEAKFTLDENKWHWFRMEIRTAGHKLAGYVNPVYRGSRTQRCRTFGEMLRKMEE